MRVRWISQERFQGDEPQNTGKQAAWETQKVVFNLLWSPPAPTS